MILKITEIHIYGYGKLENVRITDMSNFQVFFGENEAGKSTIMSFIHSTLFGFPTKQQNELRYEPKRNSKYGGNIKAEFKDKGVAVIERVKGKATGDVTVTLANGLVGGEELLTELLNGLDKGTFQSIFSFSLHGLQNIHQLKGDDLGRYLLSAGALGTDKLVSAEKALQKEMEERFKPSGKKPPLNEKLKELRDVYDALKKAEKENSEYERLQILRDGTEQKLSRLSEELFNFEHKIHQLTTLERVWPLIIEEKQLDKKIAVSGEVDFPPNGLERLERLQEQLTPLMARMSWLKDKEKSLEALAAEGKPDEDMIANESRINAQLEQLSEFNQILQEKGKAQQKIEEVQEEIDQINSQLNTSFDESKIATVNTSVMVKETVAEVQKHQQQLTDKKKALDAAFVDEKNTIEELENAAAQVKKDLLDKQTKAKLLQQLQTAQGQEKLEAELHEINDQAKQIRTKQTTASKQKVAEQKRQNLFTLVLGILFLALLVSGFVSTQWALVGIGAVGLILIILMSLRSKAPHLTMDHHLEKLEDLQQREQEIKAKLVDVQGDSVASIQPMLEQDEENRKKYYELAARIDQQTLRYERVIQAFEEWEQEQRQLLRNQEQLALSLALPEEVAKGKIYDAFLLLERLKQCFRERARLANQVSMLLEQEREMKEQFESLSERFLKTPFNQVHETAILLRTRLREEIHKQAEYRGSMDKLAEIKEEIAQLNKELEQLKEERESLFALAQVEGEEAFREKGNQAMEVNQWQSRLTEIILQLESAGITGRSELDYEKHPSEVLQKVSKEREEIKTQLDDLRSHLSDLKHKMSVLEEGGLYGHLLHKYRQMKFEFEEEAKEWAKFAIAKEILMKTVDKYRTEKLPKLLEKASEYFRFLTNDEYIRMMPHETTSGFIVERKDHTLFLANELSQATAEQVYVSLRLALTVTLHSRFPYPIIIDDSFVNFDEKRANRTFALLRTLTENQILFFTCHHYLLDQFTEEEVLYLTPTSKQQVN